MPLIMLTILEDPVTLDRVENKYILLAARFTAISSGYSLLSVSWSDMTRTCRAQQASHLHHFFGGKENNNLYTGNGFF